MNIKRNITTIFLGIVCLISTSAFAFGAVSNTDSYLKGYVSEDVMVERINSIDCSIDVKITSELKKIIRQYTVKNRKASEVVLGKADVYFPLFESILKSENLPEELKYLSIIESGLRQDIRSKMGATGLWQFMKGTGKMYGLKINNTVDQRIDPTLSTIAAAKFLKDLYGQFDNWTLALAAYNCGPGNVRKAIRKSGSRDFWVLEKYLPRETRRYIPKFIAMMYLHTYYDSHELVPKIVENRYYDIYRVSVQTKTNFKNLSQVTGMSIQELKAINPSYLRNIIPVTKSSYLNLSHEGMFRYLHDSDGLDRDVFSFSGDYKTNFNVKVVEKPTKIDNSISEIMYLELREIPLFTSSTKSVPQIRSVDVPYKNTYRIRKGETIIDISNQYHVSMEDLILWNKIDLRSLPKPGDFIRLEK